MQQVETLVKEPKNIKKLGEIIFFTYGTLKEGFCNYYGRLDRPSVKYLDEFVTSPDYTMVSCGGYPAVLKSGNTSIVGELYQTSDPAVINSVCALEGFNGIIDDPSNSFYNVTELETPYGTAYMFYFTELTYKLPVIESGYWSYKR